MPSIILYAVVAKLFIVSFPSCFVIIQLSEPYISIERQDALKIFAFSLIGTTFDRQIDFIFSQIQRGITLMKGIF